MKLYFNQFIKHTYLAESTDEMMSYLMAVLENIRITCHICIINDPILKETWSRGNIVQNNVMLALIKAGKIRLKAPLYDTLLDFLEDPNLYMFESYMFSFTITGDEHTYISPIISEQMFKNWINFTLLGAALRVLSDQVSQFNKNVVLSKTSSKIAEVVKGHPLFPAINLINSPTDKTVGSFMPDEFRILLFIDPTRPPTSQYHTLLHEYSHFVSYVQSLERFNQDKMPNDFYSSYPENPIPVKSSHEDEVWGNKTSEHQAEIMTLLYRYKKEMFFFLSAGLTPKLEQALISGTLPLKELQAYLYDTGIPQMLKNLHGLALRPDLKINFSDPNTKNIVVKFFMDNIKEVISYLREINA